MQKVDDEISNTLWNTADGIKPFEKSIENCEEWGVIHRKDDEERPRATRKSGEWAPREKSRKIDKGTFHAVTSPAKIHKSHVTNKPSSTLINEQ